MSCVEGNGYNLRWLMRAIARLGLRALCSLWLLLGMLRRVLSDDRSWPVGRRLEVAN